MSNSSSPTLKLDCFFIELMEILGNSKIEMNDCHLSPNFFSGIAVEKQIQTRKKGNSLKKNYK